MSARTFTTLFALAFLGAPSAAQDEDFPIGPPIPFPGEAGGEDELLKLFAEVELNLRQVTILLSDAGAGDARLAEVADSGIADLLRQSRARSEQAIEGIDQILEIARQRGGGSGQGQQQGPPDQQPGGQSPLDNPGGQAPGDRENTPQAEDMPSQPEQAEQGQKPQDGSQPSSPQDSGADPHQRPNQAPEAGEGGLPATPSGDDEWGLLPPRAREVFRSRGADDLPAQYRDWIEAYYRRLNRVPR